jgi:hypothetical protein
MLNTTKRLIWVAGTALAWSFCSAVVRPQLVWPVTDLLLNDVILAHPGLAGLWAPLTDQPMLTELPFEILVTVLLAALLVWVLVRFAKAPAVVWLGVALAVGLSWAYAVSAALLWTAMAGLELAGSNWGSLLLRALLLGLSAIAGAWLGQWLATRPAYEPHPDDEAEAATAPVGEPFVPGPDYEPFHLGDE